MEASTETIIVIAMLAALAVAAIVLLIAHGSRKRHAELKRRFGPEYDREVQLHGGNVAQAERELSARAKRVHGLQLRHLPEAEREEYSAAWRNAQARFVDDPKGALEAADELIAVVMRARGYSSGDFEQRVADLTVEHADVVQHYRAAHELAEANREGRADTEELRQAVVHYRALFSALLEQPEPSDRDPQTIQEAHV